MVKKVYKPHVSRLAFQAKPADDLISEVCALSNNLNITAQTIHEVCCGASSAIILGSAQIPFCGSNPLKAAAEKTKLLSQVNQIVPIVLVPLHKELCLNDWYGAC